MKLARLRCRWPGYRPGAEVGEAGASARAFSARLGRELQGAKHETRWSRAARAVAGALVAAGLFAVLSLSLRAGLGYALMVATFVAQELKECGVVDPPRPRPRPGLAARRPR